MEKFTASCTVPAVTRHNYVTGKTDVIRPAYVADIEIVLDVAKVARVMGVKAASTVQRKSVDAGGALVVKVKSPSPAAVAPITDEHLYMEPAERARRAGAAS